MHIQKLHILSDSFPAHEVYPFCLDIFRNGHELAFGSNITFFIGENGTGKSTFLKGMTRKCGIHIWAREDRGRVHHNRYENELGSCLEIEWADGPRPGAFFSSETFQYLSQSIEDWACSDPELLGYFGGSSLMEQSHGQSFLSYFRARFEREGVYFLDEPETALSPKNQIRFLNLLRGWSRKGAAQFFIATHSPILLSCPEAEILSFDAGEIRSIPYRDTDYYRIYRDFLEDPRKYAGP